MNYIDALMEAEPTMQDAHEGQGECPLCGGCELVYEDGLELNDNDCFYRFKCPDCGTTGKEWYHLEWIESEVVDKGKIPENGGQLTLIVTETLTGETKISPDA